MGRGRHVGEETEGGRGDRLVPLTCHAHCRRNKQNDQKLEIHITAKGDRAEELLKNLAGGRVRHKKARIEEAENQQHPPSS